MSREWRNWQTRTFEGRVVYPYGFKSRLSHQQKRQVMDLPFLPDRAGTDLGTASVFALKRLPRSLFPTRDISRTKQKGMLRHPFLLGTGINAGLEGER